MSNAVSRKLPRLKACVKVHFPLAAALLWCAIALAAAAIMLVRRDA